MPRKVRPTDAAEELDEFLATLPPQPPPANLGNLPDDADPTGTVAPRTEGSAPPPEPPSPSTDEPSVTAAAETDEEEPTQEPDRLADLEARLEALTRENQFFRQAYPPAAAAPRAPEAPQITPETILPFDVSETDVQSILSGGPGSADMIRNALRATAYSGALAAIQYLTQAYRQEQTQNGTAQQLRDNFYAQHPDLQQYPEVVVAAAQQIAQQYPHADMGSLITATGQRARTRLREMGVSLGAPNGARGPAPRGQRKLPAAAEMQSGRSSNGGTRLTPVERDILDLYQTR